MSLWKVIIILTLLTMMTFIGFRIVLNVEHSNLNEVPSQLLPQRAGLKNIDSFSGPEKSSLCTTKCSKNK